MLSEPVWNEFSEEEINEIKTYAVWLNKLENEYTLEQIKMIASALALAYKAHQGQKRKSGIPYISHPCAVAEILIDYGMDCETIVAALLHDVVEDTFYTKEDITVLFGAPVASLVDGVTKLTMLNFFSKAERQVESLRKMILAMAKDIRVIIVKLADRLHNMRTLSFMAPDRQKAIANETLEIYAPLASRLGIYNIRSELEDLALKYIEPEQFNYIQQEIEKLRPIQADFLQAQMKRIEQRLKEEGMECEIQGREKHIYSIYRKMVRQNRKPDEIYDFMAMRIIVDSVGDCYNALGIVHMMFKPIPGRFKDYISTPKSNMYQSLHTTVINNTGIVFEVQIRTREMHRMAEYGVAAHWRYKEGKKEVDRFDQQISILRELRLLQNESVDSQEFVDTLRLDYFSDEVFVFTPKGEVISLVRGATPIDFAYRIHSRVGDTCIGARINGRIVPLNTELSSGDIIEILTRKDGHPSRDWLNIAKTNTAKNRIRAWFKREFKEENISKGRDMLENEARRQGYDLFTQLMKPEWIEKIYQKYTFSSLEDIYSAIGFGGISTNQVIQRLIEEYNRSIKEEKAAESEFELSDKPEDRKRKISTSRGVIVRGEENMLVRLAHCCNPVPGDEIVGFITRGRGVSVHRSDCANIKGLLKDDFGRWIDVSWDMEEKEGYRCGIRLVCVDKTGIMAELSRTLSNMNVSIIGVQGKVIKGQFHVDFEVSVKNTAELKEVMQKLRRLPDVIDAFRSTT